MFDLGGGHKRFEMIAWINAVLIAWMNFKIYKLEPKSTKINPNLPSLLSFNGILVANPKINLALKAPKMFLQSSPLNPPKRSS